MMCEETRQALLELSGAQRRRAAEAFDHLRQCEACRAAMREYDRLHEALEPAEDAEPVGGWSAFEDRLLDGGASVRGMWFSQTLKLAAAFLLGIMVIEVGRSVFWSRAGNVVAVNSATPATTTMPKPTTMPTPTPVATPPFTTQEVAQHAQAFDQVSQVFDRRTSWVLLANNTSDVGLVDQPIVEQRKLLLLRLSMTRNKESVSSSDLVIVPGQSASLTVPLEHGQSLHYEIGTTTGEPTKLSLWAELQSSRGGQAIGALATELQLEPNQKTRAGELVTSSGEYQLKIGFSQTSIGQGRS